jgi:hypothetical protein
MSFLGVNDIVTKYMTDIVRCCDGMIQMIEDGTIQPTSLGHQTAQVEMKGKDRTYGYNDVRYCQFCGIEIRLM